MMRGAIKVKKKEEGGELTLFQRLKKGFGLLKHEHHKNYTAAGSITTWRAGQSACNVLSIGMIVIIGYVYAVLKNADHDDAPKPMFTFQSLAWCLLGGP